MFNKLNPLQVRGVSVYPMTEFRNELLIDEQIAELFAYVTSIKDLTNDMADYLNEFIENFDSNLYKTVYEILDKWLSDGVLADLVKELLNEKYQTRVYIAFDETDPDKDYGIVINEIINKYDNVVIELQHSKTYQVKTTIEMSNATIIGNFATLRSHMRTGEYLIKMNGRDCIRDLVINKIQCIGNEIIHSNAIYLTSKDHIVTNIRSFNQKFDVFFYFIDAWDCMFSNIRVDMDTDERKGTFILSDYSVNNQFNNMSIGYGNTGIVFTTKRRPNYNNASEGWLFENTQFFVFDYGIKGNIITYLTLTNFMFDLGVSTAIDIGIGQSFKMNGAWIASFKNLGSEVKPPLIAVSGNFSDVTICDNTLVNNNTTRTDLNAFSVGATNATIKNNNLKKLNGGNAFGYNTRDNFYDSGFTKTIAEAERKLITSGVGYNTISKRGQEFELIFYEIGTPKNICMLRGIWNTSDVEPSVVETINPESLLHLKGVNPLGTVSVEGYTNVANLRSTLRYLDI